MRKRIIAAALAAFLIFTVFSTAALAAGEETSPEEIITVIGTDEPEKIITVIGTDEPDGEPVVPVTDFPDIHVPKPFTPSGAGTVIDQATDSDGKVFYTIKTPDENIFYLVIDKQRSSENVYFLNAVTEADLLSLAKLPTPAPTPTPAVPAQPTAPAEPTPTPSQTPAPTPEPVPAPVKSGGNIGIMVLVVAVAVIGGGAGWYFKIYKPKQDRAGLEEDYGAAEPDDYGEDTDDQQGDDLPWYSDDEDQEPGGEDGHDE